MTLAQDFGNQMAAISKQIEQAGAEHRTDGWVFGQQEMFREYHRLRHHLIHFAHSSDMTNKEIAGWMKITEEEVEAQLRIALVPILEIGSIVRSKGGDRDPLHCGSGVYLEAVVVSMEPFIMVSLSTDMKWSTWTADRVTPVGSATAEQLEACKKRLAD